MSQLWVKKAKAEVSRHSRMLETINRVFPMPFEERRGRVGTVTYALHLWLADHGVFRHDTVKALNPAYEDERREIEWKTNDRKWRFTGTDTPSEREIREFAAINMERQRRSHL